MNPKISVIIPTYNAEKFIRQCLISILSSKFKDYEVIVVDDCSTDKTVAEVEKLLPHFGGRLKIISTEKNFGNPSLPRNLGIKNALGKYLTFVDCDDLILPTSLENFFKVAENFNADVVHTEKFFVFQGENFTHENLKLQSNEPFLTDQIIYEPKNLEEKILRYIEGRVFCVPWGNLFRRNFLLENKIEFPELKFGEDGIFAFKSFCLAKNYVRVPFTTYIHRIRENSLGRMTLETVEGCKILIDLILMQCTVLEKFFEQNKVGDDKSFLILKYFLDDALETFQEFFSKLSRSELYKVFLDEISKPEYEKFSRGKDVLLAYFLQNKFL